MNNITCFKHSLKSICRNVVMQLVFIFLVCTCLLANLTSNVFAQELSLELYSSLKYRHIGPEGNRVIAIAGLPGNQQVIYAGAASGGIWKSTDGGLNWKPVFDDQDVSSIGALAVAESDPNII